MSESGAGSRRAFILAIDGPAGAGKSTTAQRVAQELGFSYLDSGALYRCVALAAVEAGVAPDDDDAMEALVASLRVEPTADGRGFALGGRDVSEAIRAPEVSQAASKSSACPSVRRALLAWQHGAVRAPGTVVEGRDIGTVVFPAADLKIFLDADPDERARRRSAELLETRRADAASASVGTVKAEMAERDLRDSTRKVAPLAVASDAVVIDTTHLGFDQVVARILAEAGARGCVAKPAEIKTLP